MTECQTLCLLSFSIHHGLEICVYNIIAASYRYGYDSDDPFIDNSDVHDEIVPETLAPAHGGFYVNCGRLEFKARDSAEENSDLEAVIQVSQN